MEEIKFWKGSSAKSLGCSTMDLAKGFVGITIGLAALKGVTKFL